MSAQFFPVWATHQYAREGGNKVHLGSVSDLGKGKVTIKVLCKRKIFVGSRGDPIEDLDKWLAGGEDQVCKLCVARAKNNMPYKGGTSSWGGKLARPE